MTFNPFIVILFRRLIYIIHILGLKKTQAVFYYPLKTYLKYSIPTGQ